MECARNVKIFFFVQIENDESVIYAAICRVGGWNTKKNKNPQSSGVGRGFKSVESSTGEVTQSYEQKFSNPMGIAPSASSGALYD